MSDDRLLAALRPVVTLFGRLGIPYQIGGSVASSTFGVARSTLDIDLVADVRAEHADPIATSLRGPYYADADLIRDAVRHRSRFNLRRWAADLQADALLERVLTAADAT